jgi:uncharacterized protein YuzE
MHLTYDPELNVAYIRFRSKRAKVTTVAVSEELNVDIGPDGKVYGIELLNPNEQLGSQKVKKFIVRNQKSGKTAQLALAGR